MHEALKKKKSSDRFEKYVDILNEAVFSEKPVFKRQSRKDDYREYWYLMRHAEFLWDDAVRLLRQKSYASSVFFSIVAIEEIGKLSVARSQIEVNESIRSGGKFNQQVPKKNPLFSHHKKHQLAAFSGFTVNNRADRILGLENIIALLELAENGKLEEIRQNCIYSSPEQGFVRLPRTLRKKDDAVFFCYASGELLAEIGGLEPNEFERLLTRVKQFEQEFDLNEYKLKLTT